VAGVTVVICQVHDNVLPDAIGVVVPCPTGGVSVILLAVLLPIGDEKFTTILYVWSVCVGAFTMLVMVGMADVLSVVSGHPIHSVPFPSIHVSIEFTLFSSSQH